MNLYPNSQAITAKIITMVAAHLRNQPKVTYISDEDKLKTTQEKFNELKADLEKKKQLDKKIRR